MQAAHSRYEILPGAIGANGGYALPRPWAAVLLPRPHFKRLSRLSGLLSMPNSLHTFTEQCSTLLAIFRFEWHRPPAP